MEQRTEIAETKTIFVRHSADTSIRDFDACRRNRLYVFCRLRSPSQRFVRRTCRSEVNEEHRIFTAIDSPSLLVTGLHSNFTIIRREVSKFFHSRLAPAGCRRLRVPILAALAFRQVMLLLLPLTAAVGVRRLDCS